MLIGVDASRITRPRRTGTENYSLHVIQELLRQDERNVYRLYFSQAPEMDLLPQRERTTERILQMPRLWTHLALGPEMLRRAPDVLFVPSHVLPMTPARRNVVVVYDVGHRYFPRAHKVAEWLYVEWATRRHVRMADRLITISESSKQDIVLLYGADPNKISVASPAVDDRFLNVTREEIQRVRERHGLPERYVLYLGTVKPRKNLPRLVRAFAAARVPRDVPLVMGGLVTFGQDRVHRAIQDTNLGDRVKQLAYVPDADLPGLMAGAACFIFPSLHEGFGMPVLEAMATGTPVVTSNRSSLPEIAGDAAVLVNPLEISSIAEGIERVLGDDALAGRLREAGPKRARRYSWAEAGRVTLETIEAAAHPS